MAPRGVWPGLLALACLGLSALSPAAAAERVPARGELRISLTIPARAAAPSALLIDNGTSAPFSLCLDGATGMLAPGQSGLTLEPQSGCTYRLRAGAAANFSQAVTFVMVTQ